MNGGVPDGSMTLPDCFVHPAIMASAINGATNRVKGV
jgi:hypothetical protein